MEKYFSGEEFTPDELIMGLAHGVRTGDIAPVFCGSSLELEGIDQLLNGLLWLAPWAESVAGEVAEYFREFALKAKEHGISRWIPDPGFGFAKNLEQNYALMRDLSRLEYPELLVGVSRKSMVYKALGITPEESLPATQLLHLHALNHGATILRVHDVAEAARTVSIWRRLSQPEMPSAVR